MVWTIEARQIIGNELENQLILDNQMTDDRRCQADEGASDWVYLAWIKLGMYQETDTKWVLLRVKSLYQNTTLSVDRGALVCWSFFVSHITTFVQRFVALRHNGHTLHRAKDWFSIWVHAFVNRSSVLWGTGTKHPFPRLYWNEKQETTIACPKTCSGCFGERWIYFDCQPGVYHYLLCRLSTQIDWSVISGNLSRDSFLSTDFHLIYTNDKRPWVHFQNHLNPRYSFGDYDADHLGNTTERKSMRFHNKP